MNGLRDRPGKASAVLLLAGLVAVGGALADPPASEPSLGERIAALVEAAYPEGQPGAAVLARRGEEIVFRGASGLADVELGVEIEPDMVFRLGSITKQFTAAAILLLAEEGRLELSDPIGTFLPTYPTHGHTITVEHLLTHTSGIFSYTSIPGYMHNPVRLDLELAELIDEFDDQPMEFAPGQRWSYSNSGYVLLGAIIERVSGETYAEFLERRIFEPLGMERSSYGGPQLVHRRVDGYQWNGDGWVNAPYLSMTQPHAAGSLISSVDDLERWDRALHGSGLLAPASYARMITPFELDSGEATEYGYGVNVATVRGHPAIHHGGGIHGFQSFALHLPEIDGFVAVLSNAAGKPGKGPGPLAIEIGALLLGDPFPTFERVAVPVAELERYRGVYAIEGGGERTVVVEDGRLYTQRAGGPRFEAIPAGDATFFYQDGLTWFDLVEEDDVLVMRMHHDGADDPIRAVRTSTEVETRTEIEVPPEILERYVGAYQLRPGFVLTVTLENGQLMTQATGQAKVPVFAESETRFFLRIVDARLEFHPGPDGRATALTLFQGGLELRGERVD